MAHAHIKQRGTMRPMDISSPKRVQLVLLLALLAHLSHDAEGVTGCCTRRPRRCTLHELLCRAGDRNHTDPEGELGRLTNDAAAGILTLGKRKTADTRYQDRLQHLLHSSRNQAAGILTMGKRSEESGLGAVKPRRYPMQPADRDSYGR